MAEHQLPKLNTRVRFPSSAYCWGPVSDPKTGRFGFLLFYYSVLEGAYYEAQSATSEGLCWAIGITPKAAFHHCSKLCLEKGIGSFRCSLLRRMSMEAVFF